MDNLVNIPELFMFVPSTAVYKASEKGYPLWVLFLDFCRVSCEEKQKFKTMVTTTKQ